MISDIKTKFWANNLPVGCQISTTQYSRFEFPKHFHDHYTIQIIETGINQGFTEKANYTLGQDTLLVINPGEIHAGKSLSQNLLRFTTLTIEERLIKKYFRNEELTNSHPIIYINTPIKNSKLTYRFKQILRTAAGETSWQQMDFLLADFFFDLYLNYNRSRKSIREATISPCYLVNAQSYIKNHFQKELSLEGLAVSCNISEFHLIRQFKRKYGLTPFEYLRNCRVEKAKELLRAGKAITETALAVGFYDHSHFLRNFKKVMGIRPSEYRKFHLS